MVKSQLSPLQEEILQAFFKRDDRFFLSGGAALAGFHLGHRRTADLDIFTIVTTSNILDEADAALRAVARDLSATVENEQTTPEFRRRLVRRGADRVKVDLVVERVPQIFPAKLRKGDVLVDPPEEILANKLCTLLSRSEIRDLVDVYALERAGYSIESALPHAIRKEGGLTPANLAWVLSDIQIGDDASLPGGVAVTELRAFIESLISRLTRLAHPEAPT
ncbi:nucleotidyl transferase AbiEii/AbiGii toxin family protein [Polyangium spumosum]|uniref:nucleotidyl transferase AbiEii/AbiGii toxin family protein n=1 Tax=Polyangium spumosum TaxID=889282 RepID=UPI0014792D82|nr:nucleotidyl transferase AbiEii/AbiGii toxin family protein [Polyangium spumosum]